MNRMILGCQVVAIVALLTIRSIVKARLKAEMKASVVAALTAKLPSTTG